ncbi:hypothetical protein, conserved [Trypanosoma brucei gambiense DAL972]|uniref:Uncharacterized protein n=2 Tax=Trypanosoma brucei TaxID=5691 RepID=D0A4A7_TRYB9|nr:hypothetical protein, conserved [Trypanosoma brucei gambiense DAL972]RHW68774.1 hypothetical protein DPX39_100105100 [Trypanosoma brucei equiperdum]CBH16101.1 hypothetical protein, conserved [Trypanosoma brucei gambiense DAL972]|eukprot:XP_011778365.1 hypothetical protein, conserved [Trypanosoma brucei gambiense DAL972]
MRLISLATRTVFHRMKCFVTLHTVPLIEQHRLYCSTHVLQFDMKQYEMEKRRKREMERAGVSDDEDDAPWIAPEEQQRIDEEQQQRDKEEAERVREMLERREQEDIIKRKKFKEFRAKQLAMSKNRKEAAAAAKQQQRGGSRVVEELVDDTSDTTGAPPLSTAGSAEKDATHGAPHESGMR